MATQRLEQNSQRLLPYDYWGAHETLRDRLQAPARPLGKLLLWVLFSRMGADRKSWTADINELANACNCSRRTLQRARKQLSDVGLLEVTSVPGRAGWDTYRVIASSLTEHLDERPLPAAKPRPKQDEPPAAKATRNPPFRAEAVPIPEGLDTPEFRAAWAEWCGVRRERSRSISAKAAARQMKKLASHGPAVAVLAIEASIENDWQGLFPEKFTAAVPKERRSGARVFEKVDYGKKKSI